MLLRQVTKHKSNKTSVEMKRSSYEGKAYNNKRSSTPLPICITDVQGLQQALARNDERQPYHVNGVILSLDESR